MKKFFARPPVFLLCAVLCFVSCLTAMTSCADKEPKPLYELTAEECAEYAAQRGIPYKPDELTGDEIKSRFSKINEVDPSHNNPSSVPIAASDTEIHDKAHAIDIIYYSSFIERDSTLASMTPEQCLSYIEERGIVLPSGFDGVENAGVFVSDLICYVEAFPDKMFVGSSDKNSLNMFYEAVRLAVNESNAK